LEETEAFSEIVPLAMSDLDAVYELDQQCFSEQVAFPKHLFAYLLRSADCLCAGIKDGNKLAGFIIVQAVNVHKARLITLDISQRYRARGLGTRLLEHAHNYLKERGFRKMLLEVQAGNRAAIRLYQQLGYNYVRLRKKFYPDGTDALQMEKML